MKTPLFFVLTVVFSGLAACKDKNQSIYADACEVAPTNDSLLQMDTLGGVPHSSFDHIYVPNIFTPNGDGLDDLFLVFGSAGVVEIQSLVCSNEQGVLYSITNVLPNDGNRAWDGTIAGGARYFGMFNYTVKVRYIDNQIKTYTGRACSYNCGDADFPKERLPDCFFPSQNNGNGTLDPQVPKDTDCFD